MLALKGVLGRLIGQATAVTVIVTCGCLCCSGRCCLHTFSASLLRTNVASRVLINGEYGPLLSIAHLAPFGLQLSAIPPGAVTGSTGIGGAAAAGSAPWPDAAAWRVLCEVGLSRRVGVPSTGKLCLAQSKVFEKHPYGIQGMKFNDKGGSCLCGAHMALSGA